MQFNINVLKLSTETPALQGVFISHKPQSVEVVSLPQENSFI